jgi:hypothetical protein
MIPITIRQAVLADLGAVAGLFDGYRQFFGQASDLLPARNFLQSRFEHGQSKVLLVESQCQVVGFTHLYPSFSFVSMVGCLCAIIFSWHARPGDWAWRGLVDSRCGPCAPTGRSAFVLEPGCAELVSTSLVRVHGLGSG